MAVEAGVAQLVEHDVANVVVVGSNPITRSSFHGTTGQSTTLHYRMRDAAVAHPDREVRFG